MTNRESQRHKDRAEANAREQELSASLGAFTSDVQRLRDVAAYVNEYASTGKAGDLSRLQEQLSSKAQMMKERKSDLLTMQPELESIKNLVKDQERSKNQYKHNMEMIETKSVIRKLKRECGAMEDALEAIPGYDTACEEFADSTAQKQKLLEKKAQIEGRYGEGTFRKALYVHMKSI
jgi:hypothetical protein